MALFKHLLKLCLVSLSIFTTYLFYRIIKLGHFSKIEDFNQDSCKRINGIFGAEDLVLYKKNFIITFSNDRVRYIKSLHNNPQELGNNDNGMAYIIDINVNKTFPLEIIGFPKDVAFHPHGLFNFYDQGLYVINHAQDRGGERIEYFKYGTKDLKLTLEYQYSLLFTEDKIGTYNDLIFVNTGEFYITSSLAFPSTKNNKFSPFNRYLNFANIMLGLKNTYVSYCRLKNNSTHYPNCKIVEGTGSIMANGIEWDYNETIYVADTVAKRVYLFKYDKSNPTKLTTYKEINLSYFPDNLFYSRNDNSLYVGVSGKMTDSIRLYLKATHVNSISELSFKGYFSGSVKINLTNYSTRNVVFQDSFLGISSAITVPFSKKVIMGSWLDDGLLICNDRY